MNTIIGNKILTNKININLLSPQKQETIAESNEIPKKKSKNFETNKNKRKHPSVIQNSVGSFFSSFQGFLIDRKNIINVKDIINNNNAFGKVAGCMPRFKIGGTISNVRVIYKSIEDIKIMMNETIVESLKKKGKLLPALFLLRTLLICKCTSYFS